MLFYIFRAFILIFHNLIDIGYSNEAELLDKYPTISRNEGECSHFADEGIKPNGNIVLGAIVFEESQVSGSWTNARKIKVFRRNTFLKTIRL